MSDELELVRVDVPARRLRRGRHVEALIEELAVVAAIGKRYRARAHVSTDRMRSRVLTACAAVLGAVPGDGKRRGRKVQSLEGER